MPTGAYPHSLQQGPSRASHGLLSGFGPMTRGVCVCMRACVHRTHGLQLQVQLGQCGQSLQAAWGRAGTPSAFPHSTQTVPISHTYLLDLVPTSPPPTVGAGVGRQQCRLHPPWHLLAGSSALRVLAAWDSRDLARPLSRAPSSVNKMPSTT